MLKRHHEFFKSLMLLSDLVFVSAAWWCAFWARFHSGLLPALEGYVFNHYLIAWLLILGAWTFVFRLMDFYRPRRISTHGREFVDLVKASLLALLTFLGIIFIMRDLVLSRIAVLLFWCSSLVFVTASHVTFREGLRYLRRRGHNLRHVLIVGTAAEVRQMVERLTWYRHLGLRVVGVHLTERGGDAIVPKGVRLIADRAKLVRQVKSGGIDRIFVTLPLEQASLLPEIQAWFGDEPLTMHFVPNLGALAKLRGSMEEFDGLSIMTLQSSPLYGWDAIVKRTMDIALSTLALAPAALPMMIIALLIKLTSPGPVFYRQERMGLDGRRFVMIKFRTMVQGAEDETGPTWAAAEDPRVTPVGRWLRRMSLDELPQLVNVLRGEMSLVGPRPERPPLIEEFRKTIPAYMLRHKVKAGMTGWAQINGWRGNTSLQKRIDHDIAYIESWSVWRDVKILTWTLLGGFRN
ncbi:MAG: undecaprenyl-phosphate glucose phosphotransferase [Deltaproteobacteria bacterium]|nr:undecaprenyl-phosphate glucose phosphotransferase [Deltaproteobacteria bacterium]